MKKTINVGDEVFNKSTYQWETVIKIEPFRSGIRGHTVKYRQVGIIQQVKTNKGNIFIITPSLKVRKMEESKMKKIGEKVHVWKFSHDYIGKGEIAGLGGKVFKPGKFMIQMENQRELIWSDEVNCIFESELLTIADRIKQGERK